MVLATVSVLSVVVAIVLSYGLGMVPGAVIVARRHGVDLRATADGNPGAWNALDQLGWRRAWPAFVLDGLKGLLAAALGWLILGTSPGAHAADGLDAWLPWACVGAAMLGHAFPLPDPRRGGKAVMTFAGGAVGLVPLAALPLAALFLLAIATRRASVGARIAVFAFPITQAAFTPILQVAWTGVLMTGIGLLFLRPSPRTPERGVRGSH